MIRTFKKSLYGEDKYNPTFSRVPLMFANTSSHSNTMFFAISTRKISSISKLFSKLLVDGQILEEKPVRALGLKRSTVERVLTYDKFFKWSGLLFLDTEDDLAKFCEYSSLVDKRIGSLEDKILCESCDSSAKFMAKISGSMSDESLYLGDSLSRHTDCIKRFVEKSAGKKRGISLNLTMTLLELGQGDYIIIFKNPLYHIGHLMEDLAKSKIHVQLFPTFINEDPTRIYAGDYSLHQQLTQTKFRPNIDAEVAKPVKLTVLQEKLEDFKREILTRAFGSRRPSVSSDVTLRDMDHSINPFIIHGQYYLSQFKILSSEPVNLQSLGLILFSTPQVAVSYKLKEYVVDNCKYEERGIPSFSCIKGPDGSFRDLLTDYFNTRYYIKDHQCSRCQRFPLNNFLLKSEISNNEFVKASENLNQNSIVVTDQAYPAEVCPFGHKTNANVILQPTINFFNTKRLKMWFVELESTVRRGQKQTIIISKTGRQLSTIKEIGAMLLTKEYRLKYPLRNQKGVCYVGKDLSPFYDIEV